MVVFSVDIYRHYGFLYSVMENNLLRCSNMLFWRGNEVFIVVWFFFSRL